MSLPPALLARLAQRGLVQNQQREDAQGPIENEEVIAEDYDELESDERDGGEEYQSPPQYDHEDIAIQKRGEDSFWLERMRVRMGEAGSFAGYRGCPNKYNIFHKCSLYCVNRWEEGKSEPNKEYIRRYKRLLKKYPLPKGWEEMYDPGCAAHYFYSPSEGLVSWLPPTHPQSVVTKSAAVLRRRLEETGDPEDGGSDSDKDSEAEGDGETEETKHHREVDEILNSSVRSASPNYVFTGNPANNDFPPLSDTSQGRKLAKSSRDMEKFTKSNREKDRERERIRERDRDRDRDRDRERDRDRDRERGRDRLREKEQDRDRDRDRERDREKDRERDKDRFSTTSRRYDRRTMNDDEGVLDPMDPSAYSDIPRGKWSDGLHSTENERKKPMTDDNDRRKIDRNKERYSDYSETDDY